MILFSFTCLVSALEFFVAVQAHTIRNLNSNELSLSISNEQVTEYNYEKTIESATTDNNQAHSITTNINTDFVQTIHSSKELDLNIDIDDIDEPLNMEIMSELNMLNNNEASINNDYATQSTIEISNTEVKIEGDTAFMSPNGLNKSPNYNTPTNTNGDLTNKPNGQDYDSNGNKLSDSSFYQSSSYYGYGMQNQIDQNGGIPNSELSSSSSKDSPSTETTTSPNKNLNSAPNSNQNAAPQSTSPSTTNSNQLPITSSPKSLNGDSTGKSNGQDYDSNGNKLSDSSFYQSSSYYGYGMQNQIDQNGEIPNSELSSSSSKDSPSNETPTSPNKNLNSAPNSNQNAALQSTAPSTTNSNQLPIISSPKSLNGDSTGKSNGQDYDSNGNKLSDSSFYQSSSYYGYGMQNQIDQNGGIPNSESSSSISKDSPSNETPTSPNKNLNSAPNSNQNAAPQSTSPSTTNSNQLPITSSPKSLNGDSTGKSNGQDYDSNGNKLSDSSFYQSSSYYGYGMQNQIDQNGGIPNSELSSSSSKDSPSNETPTSPNKNLNSAPNSNQNAAPQSTSPSTTNSNQLPITSSPKSLNGDSTGKSNGQDYDFNGNKLSDSSFYQSSSYYGYGMQNQIDQNGGIPNSESSSSISKDSPSNETPTSPNKNLNSAPNSNQNAAPQSTSPSTTNSNQLPITSSPKSLNGDSTGKSNGQDYDSNGNKLSDSSFYQSSSYYGYGMQNQIDQNGEIPNSESSSSISKDSPSNKTPTSPNKNLNSAPNSNQNAAPQSTSPSTTNSNQLPITSSPKSLNGDSTGKSNGQDYDFNGNKLSDSSFYQSSSYYGYGMQNQIDQNGGIPNSESSSSISKDSPSNETPTSPNKNLNSAPNSNQNAAPQSTSPSTTNSNQLPITSSPKSLNGDSTGKSNGQDYDSNGNKLSDSSFYQSSSYYGYGMQNQIDQNGEIPNSESSSSISKDSPSNKTPTSPNKNLNSAPNSNQNAAPQSTSPSTTNSNQLPITSSPKSLNGDSTGKSNGQDYDFNGNKLSDSSFYQSSSYYGYGMQNQIDQNGGIPNSESSSSISKDSPSNETPTSPNKNLNSAPNSNQNAAPQSTSPSTTNSNQLPITSSPKSLNGDSTGKSNGQDYDSNGNKLSDSSFYQSSSYYGYGMQNQIDQNGEIPNSESSSSISKDSPSNKTPTSPNKNLNSAPNSNQNAAPQSTSPSTTNSNQLPITSSPKSLNGDSTGKSNGQDYDFNGNKLSDSSFYQSSSYYGYGMQNQIDQNGGIPNSESSSSISKDSPSNETPTSPNKNLNSAPNSNQNAAPQSTSPSTTNSNQLPITSSPKSLNGDSTGKSNGQDYDSNGNKLSDSSFYQSSSYYGYGMQNQIDQNGEIPNSESSSSISKDSPSNKTPTSPNKNLNSAPNSNQNAAPQSTSPSTTNSNQLPITSSPKSLNGDSTGKSNGQDYDFNGNKLSDSSFYQSSSYYGYGMQNQIDQNGGIPNSELSSSSSKDSPSNETPTSPNKNLNSAPNSNQNAALQSTAPSTTNSNQLPITSSPKSLNGDSTGKSNGQDYDSNGNKLSDSSFYQSSSYYGYGMQNQIDQNGGIPNSESSSSISKDSPSNETPTSPNKNLNSAPNSNQNAAPQSTSPSTTNSNQLPITSSPKSLNGDSTGKSNGQDYDSNGNKLSDSSFYQSSSYYGYGMQNQIDQNGEIPNSESSSSISKDSPSNKTPTSPNKNLNSAPNSNQNAAPQSTSPSTTNSNQLPITSSPKSLNGDSTGKSNGQDYDFNGNKLSDSSFYQSSSYYGYGMQNQIDQNGGIPNSESSSSISKDSPSNETPTSPNKNLNSPPNSYQNAAPQSTSPSTNNSNQLPITSSPKSLNGDSTGKSNGQDYDSNGNKLSDSSFYQSSSYYGYGMQNQIDQNGGIPNSELSSSSSKDSPSNETPTSPNKNLNSAPNSNQNAALQSTAPSTTNSNQLPITSSPKSLNGDSTGKSNGQDYDSNGNKLSDSSFYQSSSYYGYGMQNQIDQNGGIPNSESSSSISKDSPSNETPTSPNKNLNSAPNSNQNAAPQSTSPSTTNSNQLPITSSPKSLNGDSTGKSNGQDYDSNGNKLSDSSFYQSSSYYGYGMQNQIDQNGGIPNSESSSSISKDSPSNETPTSPNKNLNSAPNSNQNAAPQSTSPSTTNSNQLPITSSPKSLNGDSTGKSNGQDYDSNGNKLSDSSFYQSSSYYGYGMQNQIDQNGEIPNSESSSSISKDSPSNKTPTSPNKNLNSAPNSNQNAAPQSTSPSTTNSNQLPITSSPKSLNGDSTGKSNGQDYDFNGNKLSDSSFYQSSSYYGYGMQNQIDQNGGIPNSESSSSISKDSPSNETPTSPNKNLNSPPNSYQNAAPQSTSPSTNNSNQLPITSSPKSLNGDSTGKSNGQDYDSNGNKLSDSSFYQSSSYYGYGMQNQIDQNGGIPNSELSSSSSKDSPSNETPTSPNKNLNSAPNSNQNAALQSTAPSTTNSNQLPITSSPKSLNGDSTGKSNGQDYDSNGNKLSDSSFYQSSSYYGYGMQNQIDQNGGIPNSESSSSISKDSPSNETPTSPNKNLNSAPNSNQNAAPQSTSPSTTNSNQLPITSSPKSLNGDSTGKSNGQDYDSNGNKLSDSSFYQSSSYYGYGMQNQIDQNGGIPNSELSSSSSKDSPSNETPTSPNKNLNSAPNSNQNAAPQSTAPSTTNSNQFPITSSPKSLNGDSTGKSNGQDYDSNGNKVIDQSSNNYEDIQNTADQDTNYYYTPEISEYLNNQILQNSVSAFNLQNNDMIDQFGFIHSNPLTMPNLNPKYSPSGGVTGLNSPSDINGLPYTVDQSSIGTEYSSLGAETYGFFNYDGDYEFHNMDVVEVSNDEQLNLDDRYFSVNYDDVNNAKVNIPILNENGDDYNNFFYADDSVNTVRSLDDNFDTQNNENYIDDYFGNIVNMQEPFNEPYVPNLNARYENSQLQYRFNQNSPPFKGYSYMGNDIEPFDTNSYADISPQISTMNIDLYNYNNIDSIKYDQTKVGIDETSLENDQLTMSDLDKFSSTENSQKTDSFINTDLTFDHMVYNFVDADNKDLETIDSNNIGKVNKNNLYNGRGFIEYNNMEPINVREFNQFTGDYTKTYLSNLGSFETSSSNTGSDAAVDGPEGPYLTPQLLNSNYNLPISNDLNKQSTDLNSLLIDNVQLNGYLYQKIDTSNFNNQLEGFAADNSDVSPMNAVDAIGQDIKQGARDAIGNIHDNIKDVHDTTKGIAKTVGNIAGNAASKAADGIKETTKTAYQDSKDALEGVGNAVGEAVNDVEKTAKTAYQDSKDALKGVGNAVGEAANDVEKTAKTAYQDSKDALKGVGNAVGEAANDVEKTAKTAYQDSKDALKGVGNAVGKAANDVEKTAKTAYQDSKDALKGVGNAVGKAANDVEKTAKTAYQDSKDALKGVGNAVGEAANDVEETAVYYY